MRNLVLILFLLVSVPLEASEQFKSNSVSFGTSVAATFDSSVTTGNTVIVFISCEYGGVNCGTVDSISDGTNTYSLAVFLDTGPRQWIYYDCDVTGGSLTVTATFTTPSSYYLLTIVEYAGVADSDCLDQTASDYEAASDDSYSSTSATTTQADELLVGVHHNFDETETFTPDTGWATVTTFSGGTTHIHSVQDRTVSSTGSYESSGTLVASQAAKSNCMATFKLAGGAPDHTVIQSPIF